MSTWAGPYLSVLDAQGAPVAWQLPDPLPWAAGASSADTAHDPVDLGLPAGGTIKVRWRTPLHANPRSRKTSTADLRTVALACDVHRAALAGGSGWDADQAGWPVPATNPSRAPSRAARGSADRAVDSTSVVAIEEGDAPAPLVGPMCNTSPDNALIVDIRDGRRQLGATVAQVIAALRRERETGWGSVHKTNMTNVLGFIEQVLVYTEPVENDTDADLPEVAAWMRARLALPGVELGGSMHIALLLPPDLSRAIEVRKNADRRVEGFNTRATDRYLEQYARYEKLVAARAERPRGGRPPKEPAPPRLRVPKIPCEPRTEELFATGLSMVLSHAERHGLLVGPNPWPAFSKSGLATAGYRRSASVPPHRRNVPPVGVIVALADAVARLGPIDPRTGRPTGERFRAMILLLLAGLRPSEVDALAPADFRPGTAPAVVVSKSAMVVVRATNPGELSFEIRPFGKTRKPRTVPLCTYIADAITAHIAAGYASDLHLFTGPEGGPLRWGNLIDVYWRPAVAEVLGHSDDPLLRDMPRKWLRKTAITWMLRAGLPVHEVAGYTGHDVVTLYHHYAGMVAGYPERHPWTGWDAAWEWAVKETNLP